MSDYRIPPEELALLMKIQSAISELAENDSRLVISHTPALHEAGKQMHFHQHNMFEFRFLFEAPWENVRSPHLQEFRLTPPNVLHTLLSPSQIPRHCTIRFNSTMLYYLRGRQCTFTAPLDRTQVEAYGLNLSSFLSGCMAFCSGAWNDREHFLKLLELFFSTMRHVLPRLSTNAQLTPAAYIAMYIDEQYSRPDLTIAEIAEVTHFSPNYIQKAFRKAYGCTPVEYLVRTRLEKARELLKMHCYRVKEVAYLCGWNYVHYFDRKYKEHFGHLPSQE